MTRDAYGRFASGGWTLAHDSAVESGEAKALMDICLDHHRRETAAIEMMARYVLAAGYTPSECLVEHHDRGHGRKLCRLLVDFDGELRPVIEVEISLSLRGDCEIHHTVAPRIIAWPPLKTAPQVRASSTAGSP